MRYTYLIINIACIFVPLLFSFHKKHSFYKEWKYFSISCIAIGSVFLIWDELFTKAGVWGFNPDYLIGIHIGHLPLEEYLFFICIPYACSFTYFAYRVLVPNIQASETLKKSNTILALFLIGISFLNYHRWYTLITFFSLGCFLLFLKYKQINLFYYYVGFATIIPFFFMSNGILTGSLIETPIVWYNNIKNLGIRMFTIPVEDFFYGMLLIFSNIYLHQYLKNKMNATH